MIFKMSRISERYNGLNDNKSKNCQNFGRKKSEDNKRKEKRKEKKKEKKRKEKKRKEKKFWFGLFGFFV